MTTKTKAHQHLQALITSNPGISRTEVFVDASLRGKLISKEVSAKINAGDKLETKRYNRRLNRFIRQIKRDGLDITVERKGRVAHYTIGAPDGQLELPFTAAAQLRNAATLGLFEEEELEAPTPIAAAFTRANEEDNVTMDFESLLAELDEEAVAPVAG